MSEKKKQGDEKLLLRHTIMTVTEARNYLLSSADGGNREPLRGAYALLAGVVLGKRAFWECPAAEGRHQAYPGGLAIHTAQVLHTALSMLESVPDARTQDVVLATIWHDCGKIWDYKELDPPTVRDDGSVKLYDSLPHKYNIGHLSRSYAMFFHEAAKVLAEPQNWDASLPERYQFNWANVDFIGHLMLAHHGRLEWGSPVEPKCAEAWAIHAADMMSAQFIAD